LDLLFSQLAHKPISRPNTLSWLLQSSFPIGTVDFLIHTNRFILGRKAQPIGKTVHVFKRADPKYTIGKFLFFSALFSRHGEELSCFLLHFSTTAIRARQLFRVVLG
jgi:hypothetical protein